MQLIDEVESTFYFDGTENVWPPNSRIVVYIAMIVFVKTIKNNDNNE